MKKEISIIQNHFQAVNKDISKCNISDFRGQCTEVQEELDKQKRIHSKDTLEVSKQIDELRFLSETLIQSEIESLERNVQNMLSNITNIPNINDANKSEDSNTKTEVNERNDAQNEIQPNSYNNDTTKYLIIGDFLTKLIEAEKFHMKKKTEIIMKLKRAQKTANLTPKAKGQTSDTTATTGANLILERQEIVVQPLATEATGKAKKFERTGPQEFVSFLYDEVTIENIIAACSEHFKKRLKGMSRHIHAARYVSCPTSN